MESRDNIEAATRRAESFLKGHGFSRAATDQENRGL
jgi:hypothetical protein